jgi:hypothetical protein
MTWLVMAVLTYITLTCKVFLLSATTTTTMATGSNQAPKPPQDIGTRDLPISYLTSTESVSIVAIFHASFHPTRGNILDWSLRASDGINVPFLAHPPGDTDRALCLDIQLDGVEFSSLPSGLHLVEQDVVYVCRCLMREPYASAYPTQWYFSPPATSPTIPTVASASSVAARRPSTASAASASPLSASSSRPPCDPAPGGMSLRSGLSHTRYMVRSTRTHADLWVSRKATIGNPRGCSSMSAWCAARI